MVRIFSSLSLAMRIGVSGRRSSLNTCLQAPHGMVSFSAWVVIAMALISSFRYPLEYAAKIALRSAQFDRPYDAFSILEPVIY